MLWQSWEKFNNPTTPNIVQQSQTNKQGDVPTGLNSSNNSSQPSNLLATNATSRLSDGVRAIVVTDLVTATIDADGGDLRDLSLNQYHDPAHPDRPFFIFEQQPDHVFVAQSGLLGTGMPNHKAIFTLVPGVYHLANNQNSLSIPLTWHDAQSGLTIQKIYTFYRDNYRINLTWNIINQGVKQQSVDAYFQFERDGKSPSGESKVVNTFTGPAIYTQKSKFIKLDFHKLDKGKQEYPAHASDGWLAMVQHHFVSVWLPRNGVQREYYARSLGDDLYSAGLIMPEGVVPVGGNIQFSMPLYVGPQVQKTLTMLAPGLDYVVDYGWLTPIAVPIFWVLQHIHGLVGNWGWSIVILTILIKLMFFPLSAKSYRSMAQMRGLAPKLQKIKELYSDDAEKRNMATMELYKTEKINPLGGCLPSVVQIPVFIALYWTLVGSVEMRQAPFILWIHDLSAQDPYYVLPIIMGITMIIQTRLNPAPADPMQAKVMMFMPVAFSVFFLFFPAGLVLYWVVNNLMSMGQQWVIMRQVELKRIAKTH